MPTLPTSQFGLFTIGYGAILGTLSGMALRDFTDFEVGENAPLMGGVAGIAVVLALMNLRIPGGGSKPPIYR